MRALVVFESMFGNTHLIADAVASGLRHSGDVEVASVTDVGADEIDGVDLLVVGGPTHVHGMTRPSSRKAAEEMAAEPNSGLEMEPGAAVIGVREWLRSIGRLEVLAAAFDTRVDVPALVSGRASKGIARELRDHGCTLVAEPESFLVTKENHLLPDEEAHARRWGATIAATFAERTHKGGVR